MEDSQLLRNFINSAMGMPTTLSMTTPTTSDEMTGMIRIGMMGFRSLGTGIFLSQFTT